MEENVIKAAGVRPSFVSSVEISPLSGHVDASDIKKNLLDDFSLTSDISQRDCLESQKQIRVCLRIRPFMPSEKETDSQDCISVLDSTSIILKAPKSSMVFRLSEKNLGQMVQKFTFSQVFGPETTQEEFFQGTVEQTVYDFLQGHSRLIFTYGVTNAGKTYTYQGTDGDMGVLPRALDMLFKSIQGRQYLEMDLKPHRCRDHRKLTKEEVREEISTKNSLLGFMKEADYQSGVNENHSRMTANSDERLASAASNANILTEQEEPLKAMERLSTDEGRGAKFSVWVSFCEIYNECIYDLLLPISNDRRRKVLRLAQDIKGCAYVKDLQWIQVSNSKEVFKLMKLGLKHQSFASTKLNANSSRSHSIFTVKMLKIDSEATHVTQVSELFLCDLAGSERFTRTHNEGERLKESGNINTSLLILSKCINALKMKQQSKLQQHIPFRESKLTHLFQAFFSGKGKVCMIVNVSQSVSAYDETLNVLKFSAIAQKVVVLDSSNSPQEENLDQMLIKAECDINTEANVSLPTKRATILWEKTLEDVMEDDGEEEEQLERANSGLHEINLVATNVYPKDTKPEMKEETPSQSRGCDEDEDDGDLVIGKTEYQKLLSIIEELKNKLIEEKKNKLLMELRIREEVMQEYTRYFAEKESDLRKFVDQKHEIMEINYEERMQIYKDLVNECVPQTNSGRDADETMCNKQEGAQGGEAREPDSSAELLCMVESLQHNVTDIKQQTETVFGLLDTLEDPPKTIERLEKQLAEVTAELSKTQEELLTRSKELIIQENRLSESAKVLQDATEKMTLQNKRIEELKCAVEQKDDQINMLQDLISHQKTTTKDLENTITTIKQDMDRVDLKKDSHSSEFMGKYADTKRKRVLEIEEEDEEGPPAKQGSINSCKDAIETKQLAKTQPNVIEEKADIVALEESKQMFNVHLTKVREQLLTEQNKSKESSRKIASLAHALSSSEGKVSVLSRELQQQQVNCEQITSDWVALKDINREQEEQIQMLLTKLEAANQTIAEKKSKIKIAQVKIGELSRLGSSHPPLDVDLTNQNEVLELPKASHEHAQVTSGRKSSFHCCIESIWEVSKQIIYASSLKTNRIEGLLEQIQQLQIKASDREEQQQLKLELTEALSQSNSLLQEKEGLHNQLRCLQQENALYSEKNRNEEARALGYLEEIKKLKGLLEECRVKEVNITCLEEALKDKEATIVVMERAARDMQLKISISESKIEELNSQECQLKKEVVELRSNLNTVELQNKEREESKQAMAQLNKELAESTSFSSHLQIEIQRKDEEYADLKEKLADAKKQIEQVQIQVCNMRTEEKLLRNKVKELEKAKIQLVEERDVKQRIIQTFKKEELEKKLEDVLQQYQTACQDLCSKEKIIEDMKLALEEQEQTQSEQDRVLEARLEENERLVSELEEWRESYYKLKKQNGSLEQQNVNVECEKNVELPSEDLKRLQDKLKECEENHKSDRKKWLGEKMILIAQAKEAETHRNREMKRFAGDREHHAKQLLEAEKLVAEKDNDLQNWRRERDQLVAALEAQLTSLASSNTQKDKEIEELKKTALKAPGKAHEAATEDCPQSSKQADILKEMKQTACENSETMMSPLLIRGEEKLDDYHNNEQHKEKQIDPVHCNNAGDIDSLLQSSSRTSSVDIQDQSETILNSCEVSSEGDKTSRFPKPETEIHFTPLQPNKMEVKHQGSPSIVTIKVPKAKKRKSNALEEDMKSENEKNATSSANASLLWPGSLSRQKKKGSLDSSLKKDYSLRSKRFVSSIKSPGNQSGTLHKFGYFLQTSPTVIYSKAKKQLAKMKSPKSTGEESVKENDVKPKRAKRRLYSTDISSPMEISGHVIVLDQKESDHEIIKRRLRTKKM